MATLPASGSISVSQINAEFGLGNNLGAYKGVRWYLETNRRGYFPSGSNAYVDMTAFYSKRATSPVVPGSWSRTTDGTYDFTFPMFNELTVTVQGARGGQAGANGLYYLGDKNGQVSDWGNPGTQGDKSTFGDYISASGGAGGLTSHVNGSYGSVGSKVFNVDTDASFFNLYNTTVSAKVGNGGAGGGGGTYQIWVDNPWPQSDYYTTWKDAFGNDVKGANGSRGSDGSVTISWT